MSELEERIQRATCSAIDKAINDSLSGYNSPLTKLCSEVAEENKTKIKAIIDESFTSMLDNKEFKKELKASLNKKLASVLIGKFGGELESTVNKLKADPTTRAKIMVAIDDVISSRE